MHINIYEFYASDLSYKMYHSFVFKLKMSLQVLRRSVSLVQGPGLSHAATAKRSATSMSGGVAKRGKLAGPVAAFLQDDED